MINFPAEIFPIIMLNGFNALIGIKIYRLGIKMLTHQKKSEN